MLKEEIEHIEGLRKSYFSNPTTSSQFYGSSSDGGIETVLDSDEDDSDSDDHKRGDDDRAFGSARNKKKTRGRVSVVEENLMGMLSLEENPSNGATNNNNGHHKKEENRVQLELSKTPHSFPCKDTYKELPIQPSSWPQSPLMIRPTPYTSTKIIGIVSSFALRRRIHDKIILSVSIDTFHVAPFLTISFVFSILSLISLFKFFIQRRAKSFKFENFSGFCAGCILPINNGKEKDGESLVIDFESTHFIGTMMLRIKQACNNKNIAYNDDEDQSYFAGKKRKFQAVVKGRFKTPLPMSDCVTGQKFERPAGKLPARFLVTAFIKFISTLAPQLEATMDSNKPRFLTPLVATAHTVLVSSPTTAIASSKDKKQTPDDVDENPIPHPRPQDMEEAIEEPSSVDECSIMTEVAAVDSAPSAIHLKVPDTTNSSAASRMKARKKVFNTLAANKSLEPRFDTTKVYTFEFYQHLLDFGDELAVDMGAIGGKVGLSKATDGQPLKVLGAHRDPTNGELDSLWSFDLWHESLYPYAERAINTVKKT
jgi:Protein of unknown function (DUF1769)